MIDRRQPLLRRHPLEALLLEERPQFPVDSRRQFLETVREAIAIKAPFTQQAREWNRQLLNLVVSLLAVCQS
jgi:hypothetical protein